MPTATAPAHAFHSDFIAWRGGSVILGEGSSAIAAHAHYAIQLVLGMPSGLRVQAGRRGAWRDCSAALIPSRATHSIDTARCAWGAVLFVEPETEVGRALSLRLQNAIEWLEPGVVASAAARLEHAWRHQRSQAAVAAVCAGFVSELAGTAQREPSDPRVLAAIDFIGERVDQPTSLEEVAAHVHLSPGRFRHLFVEQTGMPLRTYLLWRRMNHVWSLLMRGASLSAAAHAAGFSDSAHLSRTCRTMFGLPPSALRMTGPLSAGAAPPPPLSGSDVRSAAGNVSPEH